MISRISFRCSRNLQAPFSRSLRTGILTEANGQLQWISPRTLSTATQSRTNRLCSTAKPTLQQHRWASSSSSALKTLPLDEFHKSHGAKMVEFAEHSMPLMYADQTHLQSHHWTREKASLFDVGHMLQHTISGPLAESFLHKITPSFLSKLAPLASTLSVLLHPETGGIVDDTMITRLEGQDRFRLVTNGATASKVKAYLEAELKAFDASKIKWSTTHSDDSGLLALQGPLSTEVLGKLLSPLEAKQLKSLYFGESAYVSVKNTHGGPILISRGGYTGEDGFELATSSPEQTVALAEALYEAGGSGEQLRLAGLGARDSLRLEAGMCLYGHDLDDSTTPVEAALGWVIGKERRSAGSTSAFNGAKTILAQLAKKSEGGTGVSRKRVGLTVTGAPAREGAKIFSADSTSEKDGTQIGVLTSGGPSPTTGKNIAMGYIAAPKYVKTGTQVKIGVRGKLRDAVVVKMPFVEAKYYREPVESSGSKEKIKVTESNTVGAAPA